MNITFPSKAALVLLLFTCCVYAQNTKTEEVTISVFTQLIHHITGDHEFNNVWKYTIEELIDSKSFHKEVLKRETTTNIGVTYRLENGADAITLVGGMKSNHNFNFESSFQNVISSVNMLSTTKEQSKKCTKEESVNISKGKQDLTIYKVIISGPGVKHDFPGISTKPINQTYKAKLAVIWSPFLVDIIIHYGEENRAKSVGIINGHSTDVNYGFGGEFTYIQAIYGTNVEKMVTDIRLHITGNACKDSKDLAKGAGGNFRYIDVIRSANGLPIRNVSLQEGGSPPGNSTADINKGREGRYLYLTWE